MSVDAHVQLGVGVPTVDDRHARTHVPHRHRQVDGVVGPDLDPRLAARGRGTSADRPT